MSEQDDDLANLLGDLSGKPTLNATLEKMDTEHFAQVVDAVRNEYAKRAPADLANMTDGEFIAFKRMHGI